MWWKLVCGFTCILILERMHRTGAFRALFQCGEPLDLQALESSFRHSLFQVVSVITTTGFGTRDIGSDFFGPIARQLFLVMMVIGGCVGSTSGGFKVMRIVILNRLVCEEIFRSRVSSRASTGLVIDGRMISDEDIHRVAGLFFAWIVLIILGGAVTAALSHLGPWASLSGMFSALGNIGPCYISVPEMIQLHPIIKITYIFGMLAGRLEIIPVLLLFSRKTWA
jgi:trk system potassium uptake protein TrkH